MHMDNHQKSPFFILLLCCIVAAVSYPASCALSDQMNHHSISHNPQPQDFPNEQLYRAYLVIQRFKRTITSDPKNITATWIGHDLCGETTYVGLYCGSPTGGDEKLTVTGIVLNGYSLHAPTLQGFVDQLPVRFSMLLPTISVAISPNSPALSTCTSSVSEPIPNCRL